jgi:hypothetical protein
MSKPKSKSKQQKRANEPAANDLTAAEQAFIDALIARGEAVPLEPDAELPDGATHEVVVTPSGRPKVTRRRFSAS